MASAGYKNDLNKALRFIAEKLDLDDSRYRNAEEKYRAVSNWLAGEGSDLLRYSPDIYSQGSFMLGTMVKPLKEDYDLDTVCLLTAGESPPSKEAFDRVGERLQKNARYEEILEAKNRCWRLNYASEFHMDIIPAIPDLLAGEDAILVPDRELTTWIKNNPKGYLEWFRARMAVQFDLQKQNVLKEAASKNIEPLPDYRIRTELQRAIQLMKRHRDIMFASKLKDQPISIIITTLAALAYEAQGFQDDLFETLKALALNMPLLVNTSIPRVPNPTNDQEDFADKWSEHPEREDAFFAWMRRLKQDVERLESNQALGGTREILSSMFGEDVVPQIIHELPRSLEGSVARSHFDVPHKLPLKWRYSPKFSVTVRGFKQDGIVKGVMRKEFGNNSSHLAKGLSLEYLAESNAPEPYSVEWQVVNTGREAAVAGQLRGDFYSSSGMKSRAFYRKESTKYEGMHWVEAFVVVNGVCVARSGEFVIYIN
jgi:hypothetical protein